MALAQAYAEVQAPVGVALRAMRLEALLGDPRDPANPCGRPVLWASAGACPEPPQAWDAWSPGGSSAPDELVRVLRPVFRRDLALGHDWGARSLTGGPEWEPEPGPGPVAALLGPAALVAAAGDVLRMVARIVDGLGRHESGAGQWRPVLAAAFGDLLACESVTTVGLRGAGSFGGTWPPAGSGVPTGTTRDASWSGAGGPRGGSAPSPGAAMGEPCEGFVPSAGAWAGIWAVVAVVGYVVPVLVGEVLDDLELVLNECGFGADSPERRTLAKLGADRAVARVDWAAAASWQARTVCGLGELTDPARQREDPGPGSLFRLGEAVSQDGDCHGVLAATLAGAAGRLDGDGDPVAAALARVARRLVTEQRALRVACAAHASHDPADPAARALADRHALLLLAAAVLGVREAAENMWVRFLGGPDWALLALGRITERLGAPLPGRTPDPHPAVWAELAGRAGNGVDCDLYATKLLW